MPIFKFKKSSCVIVGTFNIYIIQPKILAEMEVVQRDEKFSLFADLTQPGHRFVIGDGIWLVRPERLAIESEDMNFDCGGQAAKLLGALPWTPVMAVGVNATFVADISAADTLPVGLRLPHISEQEVTQRTCLLSIKRDNNVVNVQLSATGDELVLETNVHADFGQDRTKRPQKEISTKAQEVCASFHKLRLMAIELAEQLTGWGLK